MKLSAIQRKEKIFMIEADASSRLGNKQWIHFLEIVFTEK